MQTEISLLLLCRSLLLQGSSWMTLFIVNIGQIDWPSIVLSLITVKRVEFMYIVDLTADSDHEGGKKKKNKKKKERVL